MKETIYLETTIPSFYFEERNEPDMIARRDWTREWWNFHRERYQVYTSDAVLAELEEGEYPNQDKVIELVQDIPILEINEEIQVIVEVYLKHFIMPKDSLGDALHLALASFHKCDYLLTWNCRHIANANKHRHIRRINEKLNLYTPELVTPLQLLEDL